MTRGHKVCSIKMHSPYSSPARCGRGQSVVKAVSKLSSDGFISCQAAAAKRNCCVFSESYFHQFAAALARIARQKCFCGKRLHSLRRMQPPALGKKLYALLHTLFRQHRIHLQPQQESESHSQSQLHSLRICKSA